MHDLKTLAENDLTYLGVSMDNVTLCECKDGIYLHGGFVLPDPPVIPADFLDKSTPAGEEIIECLRDQGVDRDKMTAWSFTQLLAMKAAKEVYDYRLLGVCTNIWSDYFEATSDYVTTTVDYLYTFRIASCAATGPAATARKHARNSVFRGRGNTVLVSPRVAPVACPGPDVMARPRPEVKNGQQRHKERRCSPVDMRDRASWYEYGRCYYGRVHGQSFVALPVLLTTDPRHPPWRVAESDMSNTTIATIGIPLEYPAARTKVGVATQAIATEAVDM
ncbi:hypothetical protein PG988_006524 [Apiospora saccharicola]